MTTSLLQEYLAEASEIRRLDLLVKIKNQKSEKPPLSLDLAFDLLELGLPIQEQDHLLDIAAQNDKRVFEKYLVANLKPSYDPQTILFIEKWVQHTTHQEAQKVLQTFEDKLSSQRVRYVILMHSDCFDGHTLLKAVASLEGFEEYSDAFHALAFSEAVKYSFEHEVFTKQAAHYCDRFAEFPYPEGKSTLPAVVYLAKFTPKTLEKAHSSSPGALWRETIETYTAESTDTVKSISQKWPKSPTRHLIDKDTVVVFLESLVKQKDISEEVRRSLIAGLAPKQLSAAYLKLDASVQESLGRTLRPWLQGKSFKVWSEISTQGVSSLPATTRTDRSRLFDFMFRSAVTAGELKNGPWCCVASVYKTQNDFQLTNLSRLARGTTGLYRQVFIKAFGAFKGQDKAVLQLLDYVHTDRTSEQRAIADALLAIASPRAVQELLKFTGKPGFHHALKMRIFRSLKDTDTSMVQTQLRDAIKELESKGTQTGLSEAEVTEALDLLCNRLESKPTATKAIPLPVQKQKSSVKAKSAAGAKKQQKKNNFKKSKPASVVSERISNEMPENVTYSEAHIQKVIPVYAELSGEVQRSIRTGLFFYDKVGQETAGTMDLSPVIDMQYKAMEVSLREAFQAATDNLIRDGILQRKLDVLGYSRPIIEKMTRFENFISSLPTIKEIPYFSKFKLRKMLRGICQFRPGKRFTLDGLKAFALFFAVFSRSQCQYGLQNLFPLGMQNDEQLYAFVNQLHSFQDFRNRAVHEGLPPEASADLEATWTQTSEILLLIHNLSSVARATKDEEIAKRTREPTFLKRNA